MIDPVLLRENSDAIKRSQKARGESVDLVDEALVADAERRAAITSFDTLKAQQNTLSKTVAQASPENKKQYVVEAKQLAAHVKNAQHALTEAENGFASVVNRISNLIVDGVPAGGENDYTVLRTVGEHPTFTFPPKDHLEIGEKLHALDMARGAKVSGSRFYFLRGVGAQLEIALMNMALNHALNNKFVPMITPTLVRPQIMSGTGFLGHHSDEVYYLPDDELYLTGTSEVALAGYHSDEILDFSDGPLRYVGWSSCYRREAGSHGKDTRGIIRVHQFNKLEMFVYTFPDQSHIEHERLLAWQEDLLKQLGVVYRVIDIAAGDLGASAARKFDIEAWMPSQQAYRELTSTSNCTTFQARRLNTRYRTENGKTAPVATLNGTLVTTRWIVALLETYQQADGSVIVPEALRPYMGGLDVMKPVHK